LCKDERDVRKVLDEIWLNKSRMEEIIVETSNRNQDVFAFEKSIVSSSQREMRTLVRVQMVLQEYVEMTIRKKDK
jgi:hypothetical protein